MGKDFKLKLICPKCSKNVKHDKGKSSENWSEYPDSEIKCFRCGGKLEIEQFVKQYNEKKEVCG